MLLVSVLVLMASAVVLGVVRKMLEDAPVWIEGVLVFVFCAIWGLIPFSTLGCIVDGEGNIIYYMYRGFGTIITSSDISIWPLAYIPMFATGVYGVARMLGAFNKEQERESGSIMTSLILFFCSLVFSVMTFVVALIISMVIGLVVMLVSMPKLIEVILFIIIIFGAGMGGYKYYEVTIKEKK